MEGRGLPSVGWLGHTLTRRHSHSHMLTPHIVGWMVVQIAPPVRGSYVKAPGDHGISNRQQLS